MTTLCSLDAIWRRMRRKEGQFASSVAAIFVYLALFHMRMQAVACLQL